MMVFVRETEKDKDPNFNLVNFQIALIVECEPSGGNETENHSRSMGRTAVS